MATSAGQSLLETLAAQLLLHGNAFVRIARDGAGELVTALIDAGLFPSS
ncbi:MAG TPA: hypothetical protein VLM18_09630 [Croceibacterium sp.]|nr:hypothetical protein [Croceibacterium sp.]